MAEYWEIPQSRVVTFVSSESELPTSGLSSGTNFYKCLGNFSIENFHPNLGHCRQDDILLVLLMLCKFPSFLLSPNVKGVAYRGRPGS